MKRVVYAFGLLSGLGLLQGNIAAQQPPSYARYVRPFLTKYCVECHNARKDEAGLNLESYKALMQGSEHGAVLMPGKADESKVVLLTEGKAKPTMPPAKVKLRPGKDEIAALRAWVAAGAKDDSDLVKAVIPNIKPRASVVGAVTAMAFLPDKGPGADLPQGLYFSRQNTLELQAQGRLVHSATTDGNQISAMVNRPGSNQVAYALSNPGQDSKVAITWFSQGKAGQKNTPILHQDSILDLAFHPRGNILASASYDTQIKLTDIQANEELRTLKEHSDAVYGLAFNPDGSQLASCSADRAVKVWDVAQGKLVYTLGEATDWLYTVAWSPDGKHLAAGGVDKSIRVYQPDEDKAKLVHAVFAHEGPVLKVLFSPDSKTLYSLGQDGGLKAWDVQSMVERKTFARVPGTPLTLALSVDGKQLAVGRYDGVLQILDAASGEVLREIQPEKAPPKKDNAKPGKDNAPPFPQVKEPEVHAGFGSPRTALDIRLPASIDGRLHKPGDLDFYRFHAKAGQPIGVQVLTSVLGSKVEPFLQLTDLDGTILAESNDGLLGHTFAKDGTYALGLRDRDLRGDAMDWHYRLNIGPIPVVTSVFPLGLQRGTTQSIELRGVFLDQTAVKIQAPADAAPGSKIALPVTSKHGKPLGKLDVVVGDYPEGVWHRKGAPDQAAVFAQPGTANSFVQQAGGDLYRFSAVKGKKLVLEVEARRLGSPLDSVLEILDATMKPVERAVLRCQARTFVTFRDHDSAGANIRLEAWSDLGVNDFLYVGNELMRIRELPTHPDSDCFFFNTAGQRTGFLDTTPTHHAMNEPMYKVTLHPPGSKFPPNGFPVFNLTYQNDDGGPGFGRDSRLFFEPPADGDYHVRIRDTRGQHGPEFVYRLTVRPPRPSFNVRFNPTNPTVGRGGSIPITVTADRLDGYDGPIQLKLADLPPGLSAPATDIEPGQTTTTFALFAEDKAQLPAQSKPLKLVAEATIEGKKLLREVQGEAPKLTDMGEILCFTDESEAVLRPGSTTKLTVNIERQRNFLGRVPVEVKGLPHGVRVLDIGLNGILITEKEVRRTIVIYAEPWVQPTQHPIMVLAKREGKNSEHGAKAVMLKIER